MKTVLITGASGGIGSACAERFAKNGDNLVLVYHSNREKAERLSERLSGYGESLILQADVSDFRSVERMYEAAFSRFGFIDTVINGAGVSLFRLAQYTSQEEWQRVIGVNLSGVFHVCRAALPAMIREKTGVILNISSMWGQTGASMESAYSAAKAGVIGFTKALAKEVGCSGIRVNAIAPGLIDTEMNRSADRNALEELIEQTPLSRIGRADDVAGTALFLASEQASFITGQIVSVNGGYLI